MKTKLVHDYVVLEKKSKMATGLSAVFSAVALCTLTSGNYGIFGLFVLSSIETGFLANRLSKNASDAAIKFVQSPECPRGCIGVY